MRLVAAVAAGLGGLVQLNGYLRPAVAVTAVTVPVMSVALEQAPARLAFRLEAFAGQVPGEPEATVADETGRSAANGVSRPRQSLLLRWLTAGREQFPPDHPPRRPMVVEIDGLTKRYGDVTAVRDLSLSVEAGEVYGFLGPNGAGKSTTINVMLDFIRPTAGEVRVFGREAAADSVAIRRRTGTLLEGYGV